MPTAAKQQKEFIDIGESIESVHADSDTSIFGGIWSISDPGIGIGTTLHKTISHICFYLVYKIRKKMIHLLLGHFKPPNFISTDKKEKAKMNMSLMKWNEAQ